jgi:hypothetical protein
MASQCPHSGTPPPGAGPLHGAAGGSIVAFHAWRQRETWLFLTLQTLAVLCSLVISARDRRGRGVGGKPSPS